MSLKMKLTSTICAFLLILGLTIMGVMAAPSATVNLGGSLTFTATDVYANITGSISNEANEVSLDPLTFDNETTEADVTEMSESWSNKTLEFKSDGSEIVILITIENLATDRSLYAMVNYAEGFSTEVTKTMQTLTSATAESGTDYDGSVIEIPKDTNTDTNFAYIKLTMEVKNKNASLAEDATWGYDIVLGNENPTLKSVDWHKENSLIDFDLYEDGVLVEQESASGMATATAEVERTAAVKMVDATTTTGAIVVPSIVKDNNGNVYTVTSVADYGFGHVIATASSITSITLPDTITKIGSSAFQRCGSLTNVVLPNSALRIESLAFAMTRIARIVLSDGVLSIGSSAFMSCGALTDVVIEKYPTTVEGAPFSSCSKLANVTINAGEVGDMFKSNTSIKNLTLGDGVTSIGASAFSGCSFENVVIKKLFTGISGLSGTTVTIESGEFNWGTYYLKLNNFKNLVIGKDITAVSASVNGNSFETITVDEENTLYDSRNNCNAVIDSTTDALVFGCKSSTIPEGVKKIAGCAFYGCDGLTSVTIPDSVTEIGYGAFSGCDSLESVVIGNKVETIGNGAFEYCGNLTTVRVEATAVPKLGVSVFQDCPEGLVIEVPSASLDDYKSANEWKDLNLVGF